VSALANAATGEKRYVERLLSLLEGSLVPSGVALLAQADDPFVRDARAIGERIKSRLPGLSHSVEPLLTLWGDEIRRGNRGLNLFSPVYINPQKKDPVADEILRLGVSPSMPERQINGVNLEPPLYAEYVKLAGQPAFRFLNSKIEHSTWRALPDFAKRAMIEQSISGFRDQARQLMVARHPELLQAIIQSKQVAK
jgi:hypothetical protein